MANLNGRSTLALFAPLREPGAVLDGPWRVAASRGEAGVEAGYADPAFDDAGWDSVRLPHLRGATAAHDTLWYRTRFDAVTSSTADPARRPAQRRHLLRFGGAFYSTRVWLNGQELGAHEGYFQPFGFDVTERLRPDANLLAVQCRFPVEADDFKRKTALAGIYSDWDCKPYPSTLYPDLPPPHEWIVPVGLWQPVRLLAVTGLAIETFNVFCEPVRPRWPTETDGPAADEARLRLVLQLVNPTAQTVETQVHVDIEPHNFPGGSCVQGQWAIQVAAGERRQFEFRLTLPQPRGWMPWTHGTPWLYHARASVDDGEAVQTFGVREVQAVVDDQRWEWKLNGRRIFPKGSNYVSDFFLDRMTPEGMRRDLELMRQANLDLVRVHAHIAPVELYHLCDEAGVMATCDFPMIWTYGYGLPDGNQRALHDSVQRQVEDMHALLASRPSIVLWSVHNEPPWTREGSFLHGDVHVAETNRELDHAAAARLRELDPGRPVVAASGQYDRHLYHGWYTGSWRDNRDLRPAFPTEFGVQALPSEQSPLWRTVSTQWPVDAEDPGWSYAGYQPLFWASPGIGLPAQYASLPDYIRESQAYQAFYIRYVIDQWRRKKFNPVGGYVQFLLADGFPAITWSVLDYSRLPKAGYQALAEASRPVRLCLDLEDGYSVERVFHLLFAPGGWLRVHLYLVNDDYRLGGRVRVRWWLERRLGRSGLWRRVPAWLRRRLGRWTSGGQASLRLPRADEPSRWVGLVQLPLRRSGEFALSTEVTQGSRVLDENSLELRVGLAEQARRRSPRRIPGPLISRVIPPGSLQRTIDGFAFRLRNPVMPVVLERVEFLSIDGQTVPLAKIQLTSGGATRSAPSVTPYAPLPLPSDERVSIVVRDWPVASGMHHFELTIELAALGEFTARFRQAVV